MKTSGNTVLVTGGSAGIGFEIARKFAALDNQVIIAGRDARRLADAVAAINGAIAIRCDVTSSDDVQRLYDRIKREYPALNILVNNAGRAILQDLAAPAHAYENAAEEMSTNYLSAVRLNEKFLPLLRSNADASIVQVSSVVAFVPAHKLSTYAASKAALHSYSITLRIALAKTGVKVFEVMPPLVNTAFSKDIGGEKGIPPSVVADELVAAMEADQYEIHIGQTKLLYELSRKSPQEALAVMNPGMF